MVSLTFLIPLALFIVFLVIFIYILLFGQSEFHKNGIVGAANRWLSTELPKLLERTARLLFPRFVYRIFMKAQNYCFFSRNPFLQLFYILLTGGGLVLFMFVTFPRLPLHHQCIAMFITACTAASFYLACFSDPGEINEKTLKNFTDNYQFDGVIYRKDRTCRTCLIVKPARSKHCSLCGICVARYDHHCPWLNRCVGAGNIRWFITFLFCTATFCEFGSFYNCYILWYDVIVRYRLLELRYGNAPLSYTLLLQYVLYYGGPTVFGLAFMGLFAGIAVFCFLLYHVFLIARNTTTQETVRWNYAHYVYSEQEIFREEVKGRLAAGEKYGDIMNSVASAQECDACDICLIDKPLNIYQRGFFKNLGEIFFPLFLRKETSTKPTPDMQENIRIRDAAESFPRIPRKEKEQTNKAKKNE